MFLCWIVMPLKEALHVITCYYGVYYYSLIKKRFEFVEYISTNVRFCSRLLYKIKNGK